MLWSFCSPKGGVGVSTIAAAVAVELGRSRPTVVVDLGGDLPDIFGVAPPVHGVGDWLQSDAPASALAELEVDAGGGLMLLGAGATIASGVASPQRLTTLASTLSSDDRLTIADVGVAGGGGLLTADLLAASSDRSTLVVRGCYLCLRRARDLELAVHDVVEVVEGGRALTTVDIEGTLGRPVGHRLAVSPTIARCVDSGQLRRRMPRSLRRLARSLERAEPVIR